MRKKFKIYINLVVLTLLSLPLHTIAQQALIEMRGKPAPAFSLTVYSPQGKTMGTKTPSEYKGKWLILDFWSRSCISCITAMPKLSKLQTQFQGKLNILLVGRTGTKYDEGIEQSFQRIRTSEKLQLDYSFGKEIFTDYKVYSTPHVVVVKPDGTVYAVTTSSELDADRLTALLEGNPVYFAPVSGFSNGPALHSQVSNQNSSNQLYLGKRSSSAWFAFSSTLFAWKKGNGMHLQLDLAPSAKSGHFQTDAITLERLYLLAYLGKAQWDMNDSLYLNTLKDIAVNTTDSSLFLKGTKKQQFIYNLNMPPEDSNLPKMMNAMQADLSERFGYKTRWVSKDTVIYQLLVIDPWLIAKLKSSAKVKRYTGDAGGLDFQHISTKELLAQLAYYQKGALMQDLSGIDYMIDISLQVSLVNIEETRKALLANGLNLVPVRKKMRQLEVYQP